MCIRDSLTAVHLIGIPLTGTSVNPARSLGPALFAGGEPLAHVWLFIVAPLIGGAIAVAAVRAISVPLEPAGATAATSDETGAQLPPEERPGQIPPPAEARDDSGADRRTSR